MPMMDGLIATSKIREYEKDRKLRPTVVMAVSGVASDTVQQQALSVGMDDYLIKPISLRGLRQIMNIA